MTLAFIDELAPATLQQAAIGIQLARPFDKRRVFSPIGFLVAVDPTLATGGLVLPIEEIITGPAGIVRKTLHRLTVPVRLTFTPSAPGSYQLLLRELWHDHHYGTLVFDVSGDSLG